MLVSRGAYIRGGLYSGGAYIRDFTVCLNHPTILSGFCGAYQIYNYHVLRGC